MLNQTINKGCGAFMGAEMGLGVFVAKAGGNKIMLHQAANDGFRGVYAVVFDGPDAVNGPRGFVLLVNGDNKGKFFMCECARQLLEKVLKIQGMDWSRCAAQGLSTDGLKQEEIVNLGLKGMVFDAFDPPSAD